MKFLDLRQLVYTYTFSVVAILDRVLNLINYVMYVARQPMENILGRLCVVKNS